MLVLSRKEGEKLSVGDDVVISVLKIRGRRVTLGIEAPDGVKIVRCELKAGPPPTDDQGEQREAA